TQQEGQHTPGGAAQNEPVAPLDVQVVSSNPARRADCARRPARQGKAGDSGQTRARVSAHQADEHSHRGHDPTEEARRADGYTISTWHSFTRDLNLRASSSLPTIAP